LAMGLYKSGTVVGQVGFELTTCRLFVIHDFRVSRPVPVLLTP